MDPHCLWLEALSRENTYPSSGLDIPVATAAVRPDPLEPTHGYLSLLHFVNDSTTLHVLFEKLMEEIFPQGIRSLTGPTDLLPFLGAGALSSHWQLPVPPGAPYQPPYTTEHLGALMSPFETLALVHFETAQALRATDAGVVEKLEPRCLTTDLLPLLESITAPYPVSSTEAETLLRWLEPYRPTGFSAALPGEPDSPAGFVLLYGERSPVRPLGRKEPRSGCLWGGVRADARGQGLGRALLQAGLEEARARGWESVSVGPLAEGSEAAAFLRACGGVAQQRYTLYLTHF